MDAYDVVIVGAGPAGLSAGLILGRCRRRVLICDNREPRNAASRGLHGFLTRDCIDPNEFRQIAREQLRPYESVELRDIEVTDAKHTSDGFSIALADNTEITCRKLLLATGVVDEVPELEGLMPLYGRSVFHCPYCDGWEMRDRKLAIYSPSVKGVGLALELLLWSRSLVLCTNGNWAISSDDRQRLRKHGIQISEEKILRLKGSDGMLEKIEFVDGNACDCEGMFFSTGQHQRSDLARKLGCEFTEDGAVKTGEYETTNVPGVYVAGDASRLVQLAIVAASEGAQAAFAINQELLKRDLH